jgi:hypothetical protein
MHPVGAIVPQVRQPTCPFLPHIPTPTRENTITSFLSLLRAQQTVGARAKGRTGDAVCLVDAGGSAIRPAYRAKSVGDIMGTGATSEDREMGNRKWGT